MSQCENIIIIIIKNVHVHGVNGAKALGVDSVNLLEVYVTKVLLTIQLLQQ